MTGDRGIPRSFPFPGDLTDDPRLAHHRGRRPARDRHRRAQQAQAQLTSVMSALSQRYPSTNAGLGASVVPLHEEIVGNVRPLVVLLQIAVAVLLLIACANVAHLLLGQAATRQAEISMRYALGADRSRIIRQLLIETLIDRGAWRHRRTRHRDRRRARARPRGAAQPAAARGDHGGLDRAAVHAGDDAADGDRVRPRPGDADGAHLGERPRPHRPARRRRIAASAAATRRWSSASSRSRRRCSSVRGCCSSASCTPPRIDLGFAPARSRARGGQSDSGLHPAVGQGRARSIRRRRFASSTACSIACAADRASARWPRHRRRR